MTAERIARIAINTIVGFTAAFAFAAALNMVLWWWLALFLGALLGMATAATNAAREVEDACINTAARLFNLGRGLAGK